MNGIKDGIKDELLHVCKRKIERGVINERMINGGFVPPPLPSSRNESLRHV